MGSLDGKISLITAAAQGIGRATVEAFSRAGSRVVATDINAEKLADLAGLPDDDVAKIMGGNLGRLMGVGVPVA